MEKNKIKSCMKNKFRKKQIIMIICLIALSFFFVGCDSAIKYPNNNTPGFELPNNPPTTSPDENDTPNDSVPDNLPIKTDLTKYFQQMAFVEVLKDDEFYIYEFDIGHMDEEQAGIQGIFQNIILVPSVIFNPLYLNFNIEFLKSSNNKLLIEMEIEDFEIYKNLPDKKMSVFQKTIVSSKSLSNKLEVYLNSILINDNNPTTNSLIKVSFPNNTELFKVTNLNIIPWLFK